MTKLQNINVRLFSVLAAVESVLEECSLHATTIKVGSSTLETLIGELTFADAGLECWCVRVLIHNETLAIELETPTGQNNTLRTITAHNVPMAHSAKDAFTELLREKLRYIRE